MRKKENRERERERESKSEREQEREREREAFGFKQEYSALLSFPIPLNPITILNKHKACVPPSCLDYIKTMLLSVEMPR